VKSIGDFSTNVSGTLASAPFALAPNATKTLKYTVTVVNPYPAYSTAQDKVITNNVTVTASNFAPQHASTTVNVLLLKIAKSLNPDTIVTEGSLAPGSTFPVYLAIQNDSQVDMTGLLIDDDLSAGFKSGLIKSVSNISDNGVFDSNTKHILWANVSAPKGIQKQLAFAIVLNSTAPSNATTLTNTFTVSQSQLGKLTSNQVKVTVSPSAPVVITPPVQTVPRKVPTTGAGEVVGIIVAVLVGIVGVVVYLGYKEGWFKKFSKPESK
jgi:hypothetical protein